MDSANKKTDKKLKALEKKIAEVYTKAINELRETSEKYFEEFKNQDELFKKQVEDGLKNEKDYKQWRLESFLKGERYKRLQEELALRLTNANEIAVAYVNGEIPTIYSLNHSFLTKEIVEQGGEILKNLDFTIYSEETVRRLIKEEPDLMPNYPKERAIKRGIDLDYGKKKITEIITSGILQGNSIDKISSDLMKDLKNMEYSAAVRTARTAVTEAENAGRQDAANDLQKKGVILQKEWIATGGSRTRKWHREADGQIVDNDEPFLVENYKGKIEKLMYPGDKSLGASGSNLYNCRCSSRRIVKGFKKV